MLLYADSADIQSLREMEQLGVLSGITTNPVIVAKEQKPIQEVIGNLCECFPKYPVFAQVSALSVKEIIAQAKALCNISGRVVIKIPACKNGLIAISSLKKDETFESKVCATTIVTAAQALLSSMAGADYVAPYVGDITAMGFDGMLVVKDIVESLRGCQTKVLAASVEWAQDMVDIAKVGAHILTVTPNAALNVFLQPKPITQHYLDLFLNSAG